MTDKAVVAHRDRAPFDDDIRQRAFLYWMWECDSSIPKTARKLAEKEAWDAAVENRDPRRVPDEDTLHYWKRKDNWPEQRHRALVADNTAGALYNQTIGQFLLALPKTLERHLEIRDLPLTEPVLDREGNYVGDKITSALPSIVKSLELIYTALRLTGRAANEQDGGPKLAPVREKRDPSVARTPEQIQKERMDRMKQLKKPRRGSKG